MGAPGPDVKRICVLCGKEFHPKSSRQTCCNEIKQVPCPVCGKLMNKKCTVADQRNTCSKECNIQYIKMKQVESAKKIIKKCKFCGKEFTPKSSRDLYCPGPHYKTCEVCGKQFEILDVSRPDIAKTCSDECRYKLMVEHQDKDAIKQHVKETMKAKYGVDNAMHLQSSIDKIKETNIAKYGSEWYTQTDEYTDKVKQASLEKYGVNHHLQAKEVINKRLETVKEKYGVSNVFQHAGVKQKSKETNLQKYGVEYVSQNANIKRLATSHARTSKLEERISQLLFNYGIEFQRSYFLSNNGYSHEFDFYIPKYKLLIDADGLYFHGYLDDPDGVRVREDYDEVRLHLVPEDHIFHVLVETEEDRQLKELINILESCSGTLAKYDSILFDWCRSIEFPYPNYTDKRLQNDWNHLCNYENNEYVPQCRIGSSIIKQFHKSIYKCRVGNNLSPYEGWYNDDALKKVIRNRLIYKNDVDPSKILAGFNISKICPCISIFNPVLAKYLVKKYLDEFNIVFDPFSGFSGRLLGVASTGKRYIGHDLNEIAIDEATQIVEYLHLPNSNYHISLQNILDSTGEYECLLTCPPYNTKEKYSNESTFKTCDEWITECLTRFKCKKYVFVVDDTTKYDDKVTEEIKSDSHFAHTTEKVVVIGC